MCRHNVYKYVFIICPCNSSDHALFIPVVVAGYGNQIPSFEYTRFLACTVMIFGAIYLSMPLAIIGNEYESAWVTVQKHLDRIEEDKKQKQAQLELAEFKRKMPLSVAGMLQTDSSGKRAESDAANDEDKDEESSDDEDDDDNEEEEVKEEAVSGRQLLLNAGHHSAQQSDCSAVKDFSSATTDSSSLVALVASPVDAEVSPPPPVEAEEVEPPQPSTAFTVLTKSSLTLFADLIAHGEDAKVQLQSAKRLSPILLLNI